jgi:hypothetical protein
MPSINYTKVNIKKTTYANLKLIAKQREESATQLLDYLIKTGIALLQK